jgi:N-formylglutamate deformylase
MTSDDDFIQAFEACTIPKEAWTHRSHVRMAWIYLQRLPYPEALERVRRGIRKYNAAVGGAPSAYHETVTQAYVRLVASHAREAGTWALTWEEFAAARPRLLDRTRPILLEHYRSETISSPDARAAFVEPDLLPLP